MTHGPATEWKKERSEGFKSKLGILMFVIYTVLYLTFVFMCVLDPKLMSKNVGGLNLAIAYGFALIIVAIIQALIYNIICSRREKKEKD
jgi:uncharacterized membrane protein (DUF485 family)